MTKILANDGIADNGKQILENAGIEVHTTNIPQDQLKDELKAYDAIIVRSATKITKDIIDANTHLAMIGRAGVGVDNIEVQHAENQGIRVINTPAAASLSVAELTIAHMAGAVRFLHQANKEMPETGHDSFKTLKKQYADGIELRGKTLGLIGIGRIGQETAKIAMGAGMHVLISDPMYKEVTLELDQIPVEPKPQARFETVSNEAVFQQADFISLHVPAMDKPLIDEGAFQQMKRGVGLINCSRGGIIDEHALLDNLNTGHVGFAGLDVFENEPKPNDQLLKHSRVSATPHIGASSVEGQARVAVEMAEKTIEQLQGKA